MSDNENVVASPETTSAPVYDGGVISNNAVETITLENAITPKGLDVLSETYRNDPSIKDFKSIDDLAKSYVNAKSMIGNSLRIPSEDASDEAKAEFFKKLESVPGIVRFDENKLDVIYDKLGRPQTPANYEVKFDETLNKNPDLQQGFLSKAHEVGLNSKQAQAIVDYQNQFIRAAADQLKEQVLEYQDQVKRELGPEFQNRMVAANTGVKMMANKYPELGDLLRNNPLFANHPAIVNMFANVGKQAIEGSAPTGEAGAMKFGMSAAEAQSRINEIRHNPNHPSKNPRDPNHKMELERLQELYRIASYSEAQ